MCIPNATNLQEDFGDAPTIEERFNGAVSPIEMQEALLDSTYPNCEICGERFCVSELIFTGIYEYYTMDLDPETRMCHLCLGEQQQNCTPSDPSLWDCYTPVHSVANY